MVFILFSNNHEPRTRGRTHTYEERNRNFSFALLQRVLDALSLPPSRPPVRIPRIHHQLMQDLSERIDRTNLPRSFLCRACHLYLCPGLCLPSCHPSCIYLHSTTWLFHTHNAFTDTVTNRIFTCIFVESICFPRTTLHALTLNYPPWPRVNSL
jgi:hypothetical protein